MKKILLILAVAVCVAVAGTALALTQYNSAKDVTGTLTADTYLALSLDNCSTADLQLVTGESKVYTIDYDVTKSASAPAAKLTITIAATAEHNMNGVTVELYKDADCKTALLIDSSNNIVTSGGTQAKITGANSIYVQGLNTDGLIYAKLSLDDKSDAAQIGGTMTLSLVEVQA